MKKEFNQSSDQTLGQKVSNAMALLNGAAPTSNEENVLVPSVVDDKGRGSDIFSNLLSQRIIVVQGQVEAGMSGVIQAQLRYLEAQDANKEITMIINSPGGSVVDGLAIYDTMRLVNCPITTVGVGMQASMGSVIMAAGDTRVLAPNAKVLIHQGSGQAEGTPSDEKIGRAFHDSLVDSLKTVYQDHIGLTREFWSLIMQRDTWFSAEQAKEIGFINGILEVPATKKAPYAQDRTEADNALEATKQAFIAPIAKDLNKVIELLNSDGADPTGFAGSCRPELAVALSKFPKFWTATKKAELEKAAQATAVSNDNSNVHKARAPKQAGLNH
jgi:ATP-dependent Clp protease protease subunit